MHKYIYLVLIFIAFAQANFVEEFNKVVPQTQTSDDEFDGKIWVLLVAGSSGYYNYRHQADVCHSYQVVHNHGIPDEQIVVMMMDDIAFSEENPTPGIIINHPSGPDVYAGVPKDYTGKTVTPENFLNILTGNDQAMMGIGSGKVIDSGPKDHVFVYFADHGAPGIIAFPFSELGKADLNNAIKTMHNQNKYAKLVFYVEACESGSMFNNILPSDINAFATTAANSEESSYACYYDEKRQTYLGDRYSVSWLEDSDKENIETETLQQQFKVVKQDTNTSHVMEYGDTSIGNEIVGLYQGRDKSTMVYKPLPKIYDDVPSPDVPIHILQHKLKAASTSGERLNIQVLLKKEMETRRHIEWTANTIAYHATSGDYYVTQQVTHVMPQLRELECYTAAVQEFDTACFELDNYEYGYRQLFVLGNLCDVGVPLEKILSAIRLVCH